MPRIMVLALNHLEHFLYLCGSTHISCSFDLLCHYISYERGQQYCRRNIFRSDQFSTWILTVAISLELAHLTVYQIHVGLLSHLPWLVSSLIGEWLESVTNTPISLELRTLSVGVGSTDSWTSLSSTPRKQRRASSPQSTHKK